MPSSWRPLPLSRKHTGVPLLLVKYEFGPNNYTVWLTDLSYIWTESLDRRQIIRKALSQDTSIDPSEDPAQMLFFLSSIKDALRQQPGTSVDLSESDDIKHLTMNVSTPLPHPLQPLQWSIVLTLAPQPTFASELVCPLLSRQLTAQAQKTSLVQQLREKDNVIAKLIEKMEGDGSDLGKLFPGTVSSKSGIRAAARGTGTVAKSIKGLREFDEDQWESQFAKDNPFAGDVAHFLPQLFDDNGKDTGEGLQIAAHGEWWKEVGRKAAPQECATPATSSTDGKQETMVEVEFQRQLTPTKKKDQTARREALIMDTEPKISKHLEQVVPGESGSTTDDSDDDLQSSHSKPPLSPTDSALASNSANDTKGIQSEPTTLDEDGLTASASDVDGSPAETHLVPKPKPKPKLGRIGRKDKGSSPETSVIPTSKPKLGRIGGKGKLGKLGRTGSVTGQNEVTVSDKQQDSVSPKSDARDQTTTPKPMVSERRGRTVKPPPEPSFTRENSQERANRKREQLKRELENKSQATTKKKRRF